MVVVRRLALVFVAMGSLLQVMPASAQVMQPTFTINSIEMPTDLAPNGPAGKVVVHWTYDWGSPAGPAFAEAFPTATLVWQQPTCEGDNGGIMITGALTQTVNLQDATPPSQTIQGTSLFSISANTRAPGETPLVCLWRGHVEAIVSEGGAVPETRVASGRAAVQVQYLGLVTVEVPVTIAQTTPGNMLLFDIRLSNRGNALTNVKFELDGTPAAGWIVQAPVQLELGALQQNATTNQGVATLAVHAPAKPGWNNAEISLMLVATPFSTKQVDLLGNIIRIAVLARVRGCYDDGSAEARSSCAQACDALAGASKAAVGDAACAGRAAPARASPAATLGVVGAVLIVAVLRRGRRPAP